MKILLILIISFAAPFTFANTCLERHGALDIGSGSTKAFAAVVDVCKKRILETLFDEKIPVAFKEAVEKSGEEKIPEAFVNEASAQISGLVVRMKSHNLKKIEAVATSVFRTSKNGSQAAEALSRKIEIPVRILTQEEEANVGAQSALSQLGSPQNSQSPIIVWDIGGGSMQMWSHGINKTYIFKGDLASVSFKNQIIRDVLKNDPQTQTSPNPLGANSQKAVQISQKHSHIHVPVYFKNKSSARWLGIGGVLAISVQTQVQPGAKSFNQSDLEKTLRKRASLKDSEIESEYKSTEVTNLALVLGYMKDLKIQKVETFDTSLAQGWIYSNIK